MSNIVKQVLLQSRTPLVQFQRFRGKINIQRPQKPHYERARVTAVTTPIYDEPPPTRECFQKVNVNLQTDIENPYNRIIAKEVFNWLEHSKMVAIFHLNPFNEDELFKVQVALHRQNITFKRYGKKIIKMAVENTKYEAIVPLFDSSHCIVFAPEPKVATLLKITKKVPQMILLGGILENTLLSRNEFVNFANLPNLQVAQAQFVSVLSMASGQLVQNLEAHQNSFVNILDVYAKQNSAGGIDEAAAGTVEAIKAVVNATEVVEEAVKVASEATKEAAEEVKLAADKIEDAAGKITKQAKKESTDEVKKPEEKQETEGDDKQKE